MLPTLMRLRNPLFRTWPWARSRSKASILNPLLPVHRAGEVVDAKGRTVAWSRRRAATYASARGQNSGSKAKRRRSPGGLAHERESRVPGGDGRRRPACRPGGRPERRAETTSAPFTKNESGEIAVRW